VIFSSLFGEFTACLQGCAGGAGCRPGFKCDMAGTTEDIEVCLPVDDCVTDEDCNDPAGALYCAEGGSCFFDACDPNPCASLANSDGECANMENDYFCGCADGYYWVAETMTCDEFTCDAVAVTPDSSVSGDTCTGTERYDPGALGPSCTGYSAASQELIYSLELAANTMVMVTMSATGHDASVWATTSCADLGGAECVAGADDPEEMYVINYTAAAATYYIIADGYSGCGAFDLIIGATEAAPVCGNGTVEIGEECDDNNTGAGDGCDASCDIEAGWVCDDADPSACTDVLGPICTGAAALTSGTPVTGDTGTGDSATRGSCAGNGPELAYTITLAAAGDITATTALAGSGSLDTVLYLRSDCRDAETEVACDDDIGGGVLQSEITATGLAAGTYYLFVDTYSSGGAIEVQATF